MYDSRTFQELKALGAIFVNNLTLEVCQFPDLEYDDVFYENERNKYSFEGFEAYITVEAHVDIFNHELSGSKFEPIDDDQVSLELTKENNVYLIGDEYVVNPIFKLHEDRLAFFTSSRNDQYAFNIVR